MDFKKLGGALLLMLLGLLFVGAGVYLSMEERKAIEASEALEAEILSSTVASRTSRRSGSTKDHTTYYPGITYRYEYNGQTYEKSNILPGSGQTSKDQKWAEDIVENYPAGAVVTAYVNPDAPEEAFLVKESSRFMYWLFIGVGGFVLLIGLSEAGKSIFR